MQKRWILVFAILLAACVGRSSLLESTLDVCTEGINVPEVIIFQSNRNNGSHYFLMTPDGGNLRMLKIGVPENAFVEMLVWSFALNKFLLGFNYEIYISDRDGGNLLNLTKTPAQVENHPVPSPNGE